MKPTRSVAGTPIRGSGDRSTETGLAPDDPPVPFTRRVYHAVRRIPRGRIISYGGIAAMLGAPRAARGVGRALCTLADESDVPWWRVVNRNGEISTRCDAHGPALQRLLLEAEGVRFGPGGRIDWKRFGWGP